jgi:pimeloyl-ACP methyl ester carboxylesterase
MPQSSQALYKDAYVWDDLEVTSEEIQRHYHLLNQQYAIDPQQVILAGVGMGGEVAIWLAPSGAIQVNGFIAINPKGPYMDELEKWESFIKKSSGFHLRGMIILDDEDLTVSAGAVHDLVDLLNQGGIPCELEALPGLSQNLDEGYETSLLRAVDYIIGDI